MNVKESLSVLDKAYQSIFWVVLIVLAVLLFMCLIRAIKGPRVADRLVAVNMMGTMVMVMITVLALLLKESYLLDIGLIYAMVSFLAVVMLSKVYIGIYEEIVRKKEAVTETGIDKMAVKETEAGTEKVAVKETEAGTDKVAVKEAETEQKKGNEKE